MNPQFVCECGNEEFAVYEVVGSGLELCCRRCTKVLRLRFRVEEIIEK